MGPAILGMEGILGILPGMLGIGGNPDMFDMLDMLGIGGKGVPPAEGGNCPPAGDLTADTKADMETGDTCDTPKFGGGWLIRADGKLNFGKLEPVCKKRKINIWSFTEYPFSPFIVISEFFNLFEICIY